ncbi:uncharacterized protein [Nicotiana tomentosiformis]|uniref:uncharacterized protein n=1 Tax=Nicotiana tomentosiformis TaxID=4098 RepID=UPI00051C8220|nr:uncharacterized protein LOC104112933 [Nicotiana tomentosiformis]
MDLSSKRTPSIVVEEFLTFGSNTSPMTNDSPKHEEDKHSQNIIIHGEKLENHSSSKKEAEKKKVDYQNQNEQNNSATITSDNSTFSKSRRNSSGAFNIFRNFITCGAVETNDSSIITMNRTNMPSFRASNDKSTSLFMEFCESENFVASQQRLLSTDWDTQPTNGRKSCNGANASSKEKTEFGSNKSFSAAYKPLKYPNCS